MDGLKEWLLYQKELYLKNMKKCISENTIIGAVNMIAFAKY